MVRDRAVVTGGHRLQHVHDFGATDFAQYDAVGPHTQGVLDQVALGHLALAFDVGGPGFEPHHMRLLQREFGGIFDRDDALVERNERRQAVEHGGFTGAGAAAYQDVQARLDDGAQEIDALLA